jgi:hypothetical protein
MRKKQRELINRELTIDKIRKDYERFKLHVEAE